ncbi:CD4 molecule, partial [Chelydra serpentina]
MKRQTERKREKKWIPLPGRYFQLTVHGGTEQSKRMDRFSVMANSILAVFSVMQLGLIPTMAEGETTVFGAVGEQVILPCIDKSQSDGLTWKYNGQIVIQYMSRLLKGRTPNSPLPCPLDRARESPLSWGAAFTHSLLTLPKGRTLALSDRSELNKQEISKGNFSLILSQLRHSDAGKYVCEFSSRTFMVQLQVFE